MRLSQLLAIAAFVFWSLFGFAAPASANCIWYNLQNGNTADATQVMADFNCVHGNTEIDSGLLSVGPQPGNSYGIPFWITESNGTGCARTSEFGSFQIGNSFNCNGSGPVFIYPNVAIDGEFSIKAITAGTSNSLCYDTTTVPNAATVSTCSSDERLKTRIVPLNGKAALNHIMLLNPVSFTWKAQFNKDQTRQFGLLAQQLKNVWPNLVSTTSPTLLTPDGTLSINFNGLYAPMIASIQELKRERDQERSELNTLKTENDRQKTAIAQLHREFAELRRHENLAATGTVFQRVALAFGWR